jgi:predicted transcriptional regulator
MKNKKMTKKQSDNTKKYGMTPKAKKLLKDYKGIQYISSNNVS